MKEVIDRFSTKSDKYVKFRPTYPQEIYDLLLSRVSAREARWDCGTGNGQVAGVLSTSFETVEATDISENQLSHAIQKENISYSCQRAENTTFRDDSFDLITVAQAIHWFDHSAFANEAKRVLRPDGVLAYWGYGLLRISKDIDALIDEFYNVTIGSYWDPERKHIDERYANVDLGLVNQETIFPSSLQFTWTLSHLSGYLNTWSSVKKYRAAYEQLDPVQDLINEISELIGADTSINIQLPLFLICGKFDQSVQG